MASRRIRRIRSFRSARCKKPGPRRRIRQGMTRSLEIMVLSATAATMTMPVAADKPPIKAAAASGVLPAASGSDNTYISAGSPGCSTRPASAIGTTITLVRIK